MKENIDQASHRITLLEFVLILGVAVGGNILGSVVVAMIGYLLAKANYTTRASEWSAELLGVSLGMGLSIPLGILGGGAAGTHRLTVLANMNSRNTTLHASRVVLVVAALVSGVVLAPTGFIL